MLPPSYAEQIAQKVLEDPSQTLNLEQQLIRTYEAHYTQTGRLAAKPEETRYRISQVCRQVAYSAFNHATLPAFMRACLEGSDQDFEVSWLPKGDEPNAWVRYYIDHTSCPRYDRNGNIVKRDNAGVYGTDIANIPTSHLQLLHAMVVAFSGAGESVVALVKNDPEHSLRPLWENVLRSKKRLDEDWFNWQTQSEGGLPTMIEVNDSVTSANGRDWFWASCSNIGVIVQTIAIHMQRFLATHPNAAPAQIAQDSLDHYSRLSRSSHFKRGSNAHLLGGELRNQVGVCDLHSPDSMVDSQTLNSINKWYALLGRNSRGFGVCAGRIRLHFPEPQDRAIAREFLACNGSDPDDEFSLVEVMFRFAIDKWFEFSKALL